MRIKGEGNLGQCAGSGLLFLILEGLTRSFGMGSRFSLGWGVGSLLWFLVSVCKFLRNIGERIYSLSNLGENSMNTRQELFELLGLIKGPTIAGHGGLSCGVV